MNSLLKTKRTRWDEGAPPVHPPQSPPPPLHSTPVHSTPVHPPSPPPPPLHSTPVHPQSPPPLHSTPVHPPSPPPPPLHSTPVHSPSPPPSSPPPPLHSTPVSTPSSPHPQSPPHPVPPILKSSLSQSPPPPLCGFDDRGHPIVEPFKTVRFQQDVNEVSPPPMPGSRPPPPSGPSTRLLPGDATTQTRAVGDHYMVSKYVYGLQAENISVLEAFCVHLREQDNEEVANAVASQIAFFRMIGQ